MSSINTVAPLWLWLAFGAGIPLLLIFDLAIFHRRNEKPTLKSAVAVSAFWISLALLFNAWLAWYFGSDIALQFLTGYLIEESLSVDNLFVILLALNAFQIPSIYQQRVLFWGIFGAILMRGALILVGVKIVTMFHWILYIFGGILIVSGIRFLVKTDEEGDITKHWAIRLLKRFIPVTPELHGQNFVIKEGDTYKATRLLVALVVIEASDLIFAVDSIPAVFGVTTDSFLAFSSNIMAVLGLRSLFFVIADLVARLRYLKPGLATILCFVGVKMLIADLYPIPNHVSLLVITLILITSALSSWYVSKREGSVLERKTNRS